MFVIEIIEPVLTFQQKTAEEMLRKLNTAIKKSVPNIRTNARSATLNFLRNSREYQSLVGGKLMGHFGLPHDEATRMVEGIIGTIAENLQVSHTIPVGAARFRTAGDLEISVVEADFSDILSLPEALIYTDKGEILPWLEWLLTAGDRILINTHRVILGDFSNSKFRSRSKKGLMIQAKGTPNTWRVPTEFSGTPENNWLTRTLQGLNNRYQKKLASIIQAEIRRRLS